MNCRGVDAVGNLGAARRHGVDADAVAAVFHRHHLGQRQDAAFAGGVRQPVEAARRLRAEIHDRAGALLHHDRQHGEAAPQRRIQRALELQLHLLLGVEVERLDPDGAADVVDQHVDPAIARRRPCCISSCAPAKVPRSTSTFSAFDAVLVAVRPPSASRPHRRDRRRRWCRPLRRAAARWRGRCPAPRR